MSKDADIEILIKEEFAFYEDTIGRRSNRDLVTLRKALQKRYKRSKEGEGKLWLAYINKIKREQGRYPSKEDKDAYFKKHNFISTDLYNRLKFVKNAIYKRSVGELEKLRKVEERKHKGEEGLFFAIDVETKTVFKDRSRREILEKARSRFPDGYFYTFVIGKSYRTILK